LDVVGRRALRSPTNLPHRGCIVGEPSATSISLPSRQDQEFGFFGKNTRLPCRACDKLSYRRPSRALPPLSSIRSEELRPSSPRRSLWRKSRSALDRHYCQAAFPVPNRTVWGGSEGSQCARWSSARSGRASCVATFRDRYLQQCATQRSPSQGGVVPSTRGISRSERRHKTNPYGT